MNILGMLALANSPHVAMTHEFPWVAAPVTTCLPTLRILVMCHAKFWPRFIHSQGIVMLPLGGIVAMQIQPTQESGILFACWVSFPLTVG